MVPTPSQLSGPLSHYKKFWILQTQLADSAASSSSCHIPPVATASTAAVNNSCDHSNNNIQLHRHNCSTTTCASSSKQLVDAWKLPKQETFPPASDGDPRISSGRLFSDDKGVMISSGCGSTLAAAAPFKPAHVRDQYDHRLFNPSCAAAPSPFIYTDSSSFSPTNFMFDKPGEAHSIDRASDELINPLNASEESINLREKYVRSGMKLAACAASDRSSSPEQSSQEYECDRDDHRQDECDEYDDEVNVDQRQQLNSSGFYFTPGNNSIPNTIASISAGSSLQSRSCTLCGTTKTPLWRSGPQGPKSLCNACGIRVKKAKRLQEAAAAAERMNIINGSAPAVIKTGSASLKPLLKKRKLSEHANAKERLSKAGAMKTVKQRLNLVTHHKKINPFSSNINTAAKHGSGSLSRIIESNQSSGSARSISTTQTYAKDEEEAAVLLMALSCGLVLA